ncbi:MAG: tRNA (guanosine(37)-N1)-methyltransferase TrmD [Rhizobiales bacterium TMED94]|nr:tRNA (guanosine(37)-N1)-methyltransferase TrmD [Rhodobiaceae bacterium]RPF88556.1 MAG: tRNA (guanosine(37)-N1)-methyltransferase TrmD [Rhizobiales bacterium TMED94]|tara:strand:- start:1018 stop:1710 length:693 start_codon:yes stop_codon:yes gene_type:complete
MTWSADILTLYPEMFPGPLDKSLSGKALEKGIWSLNTFDLKDYGLGPHKSVDEKPSGGGPGMVLRADVLDSAINDCFKKDRPVIYFSPKGKPLDQEMIERFSVINGVSIICGHFEGIDQRIIDLHDIEEISVGDYILSGGEIATIVFLDSLVRLLPNVLGNGDSKKIESFTDGLLEYPQYTKPNEFKGMKIPDILLSGNHKAIKEWQENQSLSLTKLRRPDLITKKKDKI